MTGFGIITLMNSQIISGQVEVFFVATLLFSVFYVLFLALTLYVPIGNLLRQLFTKKNAQHNISGHIIYTNHTALQRIRIEAKETSSGKNYVFFSRPDGSFTLHLPDGNFKICINQFGLKQLGKTDFILSDKDCPTRLDIKVKLVEQLIINPLVSKFICHAKLAWLALALAGFVLNFLNIEYITLIQSFIVMILAMICAYMAVQSEKMFFKLMDFTNKPLRGKKIVIKDSRNQALANLSTNQSGQVNIFASRGIYKIEADSHLQRTFRVSQDSIVNLKLKL